MFETKKDYNKTEMRTLIQQQMRLKRSVETAAATGTFQLTL